MKAQSCESCLIPFNKDAGQRESEKYCSLCFKNGKLCYEGNDLNEFKREAYKGMRARGGLTPSRPSFLHTWSASPQGGETNPKSPKIG